MKTIDKRQEVRKEEKVDGRGKLGKIAELRKKIAKGRLEMVAGKLKDVRVVKKMRKELARLLTSVREEELAK